MNRFWTWLIRIDWTDLRRHEYSYERYVDTLVLAARKGWI